MYHFVPETDRKAFDAFVSTHHGQFQQCSLWPQVKTAWQPLFYAGFDENGGRVLTCLILERRLPAVGRLWYVPYGMVCDYADEALQREFASFLRGEMKKHHAFVTIIDPPVPLRIDGTEQEEGHRVHRMLTGLGYLLNTDLDSYTYKHPVQTPIPLRDEQGRQKTAEEIIRQCEKGVRYSTRVGASRGLVFQDYRCEDILADPKILQDFSAVLADTSERADFVSRDTDYIRNLVSVLKDYTDILIVYYDKAGDRRMEAQRQEELASLRFQLETAPHAKQGHLKNEIATREQASKSYQERLEETKSEPDDAKIAVAAGLTVRYAGYASCVMGGSRNLLRNNTRSSHYLNYIRLCQSIEQGMEVHDLGFVMCQNPQTLNEDGSLGPLTPNEEFAGISKFKQSFTARFTEYIGEYMLVGSPARYRLYRRLLPRAKSFSAALASLRRRIRGRS